MEAVRRFAHWVPSGRFEVPVVGESYCRETLAKLAGNRPGLPARVLCLAALVLDDDNPMGAHAVRVEIDGWRVGYLPAELAVEYRGWVADAPPEAARATVAAMITGGLVTLERQYDYSVELDIPPDLRLQLLPEALDMEAEHLEPYPDLRQAEDGSWGCRVWVPLQGSPDIDPRGRVESWSGPSWSSVGYFLRERRGIGLGTKIYEVPKALHHALFGEGETEAAVEWVAPRFAQLSIRAVA